MALVKFGAMIADARGSIGGTVFARNRGGAYVRNRTTPINPQSTRQTAVRSLLASLTNLWSTTLTQAQRDAWTLYATNVPLVNSLGESRNVTGINMYVRANSLILDTGGTRADDAPTIFTVGPTITPTFTVDAANDELDITDLGSYDLATGPVNLLISAGNPVQAGVNFYKSPFRKVGAELCVETSNEPPYGPFALNTPVSVGQALFVRTACVTPDGRVGVPVVQRFLVA